MTVAVAREVVYAGFWRRAGAFVVDGIALSIISAGLLFVVYGADYFTWLQENDEIFGIYGAAEPLINYLLPTLIIVGGWRYFGASPGKFLLGCQVVDAETYRRVTWGQALLRYVCYLVSALPLGLGYFWVAWDKRRQSFHDRIAKTVVIMEDESTKHLADLEREFLR